jgi:uncharacterized protein (TIGR03083 family)
VPTQLTTAEHLDGLHEALVAFVRYADRAGLDARVPTCPEWTVRQLVAHQGMVHRWAAALLRGENPSGEEVNGFETDGLTADDPLAWLRAGGEELARVIRAAPDDAEALVFLNDAPAPRAFWARRQCHETTIHAVDALSAVLGRPPRADEVWVGAELAADGIDELLGGFLTRPRSRLRCDEDAALVVVADDTDDWWEVELGPRPAVTTRRTGGDVVDGDWELTGPAAELYLRLWNRSRPVDGGLGSAGGEWQRLTAVTWS